MQIFHSLPLSLLLIPVGFIPASCASELGTNLEGIADWSPAFVFRDIFKYSREWIPQTPDIFDTGERALLDLDENGWLRSLPTAEDNVTYTQVATVWAHDPHHPGGRYVVRYDGNGTIVYGLGASKIDAESVPGRDVLMLDPDVGIFVLTLVQTDPGHTGDYLRNIRVTTEADEHADLAAQPFNPDYVKAMQPYSVVRFMDWGATNNSPLSAWSDRPRPENARYSTALGVPIELMTAFANQTGSHAWFTMPHQADDAFIAAYAQLVLDNLDMNLDVYVEYSNEVWNGGFGQSSWVTAQAQAAWPSAPDSDFTKMINWYGMRSAQTCETWKNIWAEHTSRVHCVMGAQAANSWTASQALECPLWSQAPCAEHGMDAVAIAPYFGGYLGTPGYQQQLQQWIAEPDGGYTALFNELTTHALPQSTGWIDAQLAVSRAFGLDLVAYEGGQHLAGVFGVENDAAVTQLFIGANRDARMQAAYETYFNTWRERVGGLFMHFTDYGAYSKWGSWGTLEYLGQKTSPKFQGLKNVFEKEDMSPMLYLLMQ